MVISAIEYVTHGFSVIPLSRTSKRPVGEWSEYQTKVADIRTLMKWFRGKALNIAIICGEISQNLVVIDFDDPDYYIDNALLLKDFPVIKTKNGYHVYVRTYEKNYYRNTKLIIKNRDVKVELRAGGGYVAAPPSVHSAGLYRTISGSILLTPTIPKNMLVDILEEISGRPIPEKKERDKLRVSYNPKHASNTLEIANIRYFIDSKVHSNICAVKNAYPGNRNNQLFQSACYLGELVPNGYIDLDSIADMLYQAATESGLVMEDGADAVTQTIHSGLSRGVSQPVRLVEDELFAELN